MPVPGAPPAARVPLPERFVLSTGLRVIAVPRAGLPQVAIRLIVPAGSAADPADFPGTAALTGAILTEGTDTCPADEMNRRLDRLGASLEVQVGHDFAEVDLVLLSETLERGLDLFGEILTSAAFPGRETERIRAEMLDFLEARRDEPANLADDSAAMALFGANHPYAQLTSGTPEGISSVPRDELIAFHARHYRPSGSALIVAGDFDLAVLASLLERALEGWAGIAPEIPYAADPPRAEAAGEYLRLPWEGAAQGEIRVCGLGMTRSSPDWIAGAVANHVLGGSTITGRLGANLREDKGWTYGVRCGFAGALRRGGWAVETAVDVAVADDAVAEIIGEIERFSAETVPEIELERARQSIILSLPRAFETPGRIVGRFATIEAYGLEQDYWELLPGRVRAVTVDDVTRIARAYFRIDELVRLAVG
jgi:zinc protease